MAAVGGVDWDYTGLAAAVDERPGYSEQVIEWLLGTTGLPAKAWICDIGAGTGKLTLPLARRGFRVVAVEPNHSMLELGVRNSLGFGSVRWVRAIGESTGLDDDVFDLVSFGSSFNVVDQTSALAESARILKPGGWLACVWNHRDLSDPIQGEIEALIRMVVPNYRYGVRRQDQTRVIARGGLFGSIQRMEAPFVCRMSPERNLKAWRSHATLRRQAGDLFESVLDRIGEILKRGDRREIAIPYVTRAWLAKKAMSPSGARLAVRPLEFQKDGVDGEDGNRKGSGKNSPSGKAG